MRCTLSQICLAVVCVLISGSAWAQSANLGEPCADGSGGLVGNASEIKDAVDKYEKPPFAKACQAPGALKDRPSTSFLHIFPPTKDSSGHTSLDFLERVQKKVAAKVAENEQMGKAIGYCANPANASLKCASGKAWISGELTKRLQVIRYNLALANNPDTNDGFFKGKRSLADLNSDMNTMGSYKEEAWQPLSEAEKADANRVLDSYKVKAMTESKGEKYPNVFAKDMIRTLRYQHYQEYLRQMAQIPFAQYLKSGNPSEAEVQTAAAQFTKNVLKEKKKIDGLAKDISDARKNGGGVPADVMELLNYSSIVEDTLLESPEYCGLATSLIYSRSNKDTAAALAIGLPVLAATFFAPPIAAVTIGIAGGAIGLANSQLALSEAKRQGLNNFYNDNDPDAAVLKQMSDAQKDRDLNIIALPAGYGMGVFAASTVRVMAKAAIAANRLGAGTRSLRETSSIASEMRAALGPAEGL